MWGHRQILLSTKLWGLSGKSATWRTFKQLIMVRVPTGAQNQKTGSVDPVLAFEFFVIEHLAQTLFLTRLKPLVSSYRFGRVANGIKSENQKRDISECIRDDAQYAIRMFPGIQEKTYGKSEGGEEFHDEGQFPVSPRKSLPSMPKARCVHIFLLARILWIYCVRFGHKASLRIAPGPALTQQAAFVNLFLDA